MTLVCVIWCQQSTEVTCPPRDSGLNRAGRHVARRWFASAWPAG
jgi:hypothetical protein